MQVFTKNKSSQASVVFDLFLIGPTHVASQVVLVVKKLPANTEDIRDVGFIPGLGRSPGGGHGNPLQYACLETPHGQKSLAGYSP